MSRTTFKHVPLTRPAEQIRLLKLQPDIDALRLKIQTYELTKCPRFVALSYEWGDGSEIHDITIDGAVLKIRQNLRDALEHIRILQADTSSTRLFKEDSPYFWIDTIAIDQAHDKEKCHQVSIMGKIYRQASHVIAWLGLEQNGDDSALALDYLNTGPKLPRDYQWKPPELVTISAKERAIRRLCDRSYFQRMWVVQECVLARQLHFVCGLRYCSWKHLYEFVEFLHYKRVSQPVNELLVAKARFEHNWFGGSMQETMSYIIRLADGRHCSRSHDRIYGLIGILQQSFQTTVMDVDYGLSLQELMIKTQEFVTSDLLHSRFVASFSYPDSPLLILKAFEPVTSRDVRGGVACYWHMNEIMCKLDAEFIKGFDSLKTLHGEKERTLTFQTICWIFGGYGIDLFSPIEGSTLNTTTTMQTISLESRNNEELWRYNEPTLILHSRYTIGTSTYRICSMHRPLKLYCLPVDCVMTETISRECRTLLETYSKHVRFLGILRENSETSTEVSDLEEPSPLPIRIQWMVFSNLLARYFLSKCGQDSWPDRDTRTDGFVRQIEREGMDLGTFLSKSLFSKYRMSVANASDELPPDALALVEIEITNSNGADDCSDSAKRVLVASLYDNDREPSRKRKRRDCFNGCRPFSI